MFMLCDVLMQYANFILESLQNGTVGDTWCILQCLSADICSWKYSNSLVNVYSVFASKVKQSSEKSLLSAAFEPTCQNLTTG